MNKTLSTEPATTDDARRVIVLDTDAGVRWSLERGLQRSGYHVQSETLVGKLLTRLNTEQVDVVVMEILPEAGLTLEALSSILHAPYAPEVVCISIDSTPQMVIECMRRGACNFLVKPFSLAEVRGAVSQAIARNDERTERGERSNRAPSEESSLLIGASQAMQELRKVVQKAARTDLNCLVRGESGVGKDLVAREIHRLSPQRHEKAFIKVNCSALPETLLESELFGYEKGAFTGADTAKPGRFSLAHHGIIFLDEIGDMAHSVQAKILQVIEHKEFTKLGSGDSVKVDVQIVAATNADLEHKIASGLFRDDLYFRLNEVYIWVPPLAERREDIPLLVHHFVRKHSHYSSATETELTESELESLADYDWPGNVRELESTIKRWLALGDKNVLVEHTRQGRTSAGAMHTKPAKPNSPEAKPAPKSAPPTPDAILKALEDHQWNRRKAAEALGMSYPSLRRAIEKHELDKRQ